MEIPFGKPIVGDEEREAVTRVLEGTTYVHGPKTKEFETEFAKFTGAPHASSICSCTAALHLAYFSMGLSADDEVIVPAQTHVATAHAVEFCGAKPVFVDAEIEMGNIAIDQIEAQITSKTRALSLVHYLGMPVDMDRFMAIAKKHDLFVVEDCALAIGAKFDGTHVGLHGNCGCFSFYPIKHMTTVEGGMLITKYDDLAKLVNHKKSFGLDRTVNERKVPGVYDVTTLGFNFRMNELEAAIGVEQLKRIQGFIDKRKENYLSLEAQLKELDEISLFQSSHGKFESSYYCLSFMLSDELTEKRLEIIKFLNGKGVGTSIYYPSAVPHLTYYKDKYSYGENTFPVAKKISNSSIAVSVGPHLNTEHMNFIAENVKSAVRTVK